MFHRIAETALEYFTLVSTGEYSAQLQLLKVPADLTTNYTYEVTYERRNVGKISDTNRPC